MLRCNNRAALPGADVILLLPVNIPPILEIKRYTVIKMVLMI
jgi:hypothetical protein